MIAQLLFYKIAQFFVIMLIGFFLVKSKLIKGEDSVVLSKINLFLLMPAAIIGSFVLENRSPEVLGGIALAFAGAFAIHGVFLAVDFFYKKLFRTGKVERTSVFYSNSGNMILPIVGFVMGEEWVIYSAAYLSVQQLFLWTHCVSIFESRKKIELKKIVSNTNVIAIAIGALIMIFDLRLPEFADNIMSSFSGMLGPVSMLIQACSRRGLITERF